MHTPFIVALDGSRALGSDYIVIGRSLTRAADPLRTYARLQHEWNGGERESTTPT